LSPRGRNDIRRELTGKAVADPDFQRRMAGSPGPEADSVLAETMLDYAVHRIFELESYVQLLEGSLRANFHKEAKKKKR
jgi:hypothetical protein